MQISHSDGRAAGHIRVQPAWTAYFDAALTTLVILLVGSSLVALFASLRPEGSGALPVVLAAVLVLLVTSGVLLYEVALIRSRELYTDEAGVHYRWGVLPWARGIVWVRWHDLDTVTCTSGLRGWLLNSYRVRIGHRSRPGSAIVMSDVAGGRQIVGRINLLRQHFIGLLPVATPIPDRR